MALTNDMMPQFLPKCFTPYKSPTNVGTTLICVPTAADHAKIVVKLEEKIILRRSTDLELSFRIIINVSTSS